MTTKKSTAKGAKATAPKLTLGQYRVQYSANERNAQVRAVKEYGASIIDAALTPATQGQVAGMSATFATDLKNLQAQHDASGDHENARCFDLAQQQIGIGNTAIAEKNFTWAHTAFEIATMLAVKALTRPALS